MVFAPIPENVTSCGNAFQLALDQRFLPDKSAFRGEQQSREIRQAMSSARAIRVSLSRVGGLDYILKRSPI
jgi:hypothetical protein